MIWRKNKPITKTLTQIVNKTIEKVCNYTSRFVEETVNSHKSTFEEIF